MVCGHSELALLKERRSSKEGDVGKGLPLRLLRAIRRLRRFLNISFSHVCGHGKMYSAANTLAIIAHQ